MNVETLAFLVPTGPACQICSFGGLNQHLRAPPLHFVDVAEILLESEY